MTDRIDEVKQEITRLEWAIEQNDLQRTELVEERDKIAERVRYIGDMLSLPFEAFRSSEGLSVDDAARKRTTALTQRRNLKKVMRECERSLRELTPEKKQFNTMRSELLIELAKLEKKHRMEPAAFAIEVIQELRLAIRDAFDAFGQEPQSLEQKAALERMLRAGRTAKNFVWSARSAGLDTPQLEDSGDWRD